MKKMLQLLTIPVLLCAVNANATNLLNNAGFESSTLGINLWNTDGIWNGEQNGSIVSGTDNGITAAGGNGMFRMGDAGGGSAAQMAQWVPGNFLAGTTLTFDVLLNANNANAQTYITINSATTAVMAQAGLLLDDIASTWQSSTVSTTLTSDVTGVYVQVWTPMTSGFGGGNYIDIPGNYLYIDNAVLTATGVPAPGAIALFGLGLLGMGAIRRKLG